MACIVLSGPVVLVAAGLSFGARGKGAIMGFSLSVPRFGFEPQICLARPVLLDALACYERADYIGAGVRLRESIRRFLVAACRWYAVPLLKAAKRDKYARNLTLAKALRNAKAMDEFSHEIICECIEIGNKAAHCRPFCVKSLKSGISILFELIDSEPYSAMRERQQQPTVAPFESADYEEADDCCDDDDGSDWWKPSDWNPQS